MKEITVASVFVQKMTEGARLSGLDCQSILLRHGISELSLHEPQQNLRVPLENFAAFAVEVMKALDDEFLGLTEHQQRLGSFNMMCRCNISAKTIGRSLKRTANYWNLFANTYYHKVIVGPEKTIYRLDLRSSRQPLNNCIVESMLSSVHRFHCWLAGQFIPLIAVSLDSPEPFYASEYKAIFYDTPVKYLRPYNQIELNNRYLDLDIVQTPATLDQYLLDSNLSLLYQPKNYRLISDQVRQWLEKNIRQGNYQATLKQAAQHFQMSQQVLHRRLQAEDLSFKELKMQTRRDLAINLLFVDRFKIEQIATMVGYSEPSAFIRAFKSWTGVTPLSYKQKTDRPQY